jgi:hypothetical protein
MKPYIRIWQASHERNKKHLERSPAGEDLDCLQRVSSNVMRRRRQMHTYNLVHTMQNKQYLRVSVAISAARPHSAQNSNNIFYYLHSSDKKRGQAEF